MNQYDIKGKRCNDVFINIMKKHYKTMEYNTFPDDKYSRADIEITATTENGHLKIYTAELKLRQQSYKECNYDTVLLEKSKYDALKAMQKERPDRKYYYINMWERDKEIHFFNIDIVEKQNISIEKIKCRKNNQGFDYIEKEVYFLPIDKAIKFDLNKLQYDS